MDSFALITQATYHSLEYGLYCNEQLIEQQVLDKMQAATLFMDHLTQLLQRHKLAWTDIAFIGANQGPAPFTTLRALIATLNGISFATGIGLKGVDGLVAYAQEQYTKNSTIVLLNAFAGDVYFAIHDGTGITTGWHNGNELLTRLMEDYPTQLLTFVGNGTALMADQITTLFGKRATVIDPSGFVSLGSIAQICFKKQQKEVPHLTPLYLKTQHYKPSC